ncbi:2'-5' RNA ligase family protein [Ferrovibrio sp.]|uniref:2'-5' RNA ligase family protein n=1 Tax=Ferrovibrio sp. TaxID=1917215 RepID=UPI00311E9A4B
MLAAIAIPEFDAGAAGWIAALRAAHDPQQDRVPPHVTLVFPQAADEASLLARLQAVAQATQPFAAGFDRLGRMDDSYNPKYRHLNVLHADAAGAAALTVLHAALNAVPSPDYAAHVTVARFGAVYCAKALERQLGGSALRPVLSARFSGLQLLRLENGAVRVLADLPFAD